MIFFPFTIILVRSYEDELSVLVIFKGVCLLELPLLYWKEIVWLLVFLSLRK